MKIDYKPIFEYIDKTNQEITADIKAEFKGDFDRIFNLMDSYMKETKTCHDESKILGHRVTRLENWAGKVSKKVQIPTGF